MIKGKIFYTPSKELTVYLDDATDLYRDDTDPLMVFKELTTGNGGKTRESVGKLATLNTPRRRRNVASD